MTNGFVNHDRLNLWLATALLVVGLGAFGGLFFRIAQVSWYDYKRAFVCNCPSVPCPDCSPEYCASLERAACERQFGVGAVSLNWCQP